MSTPSPAHDPLCPMFSHPHWDHGTMCRCDLIADAYARGRDEARAEYQATYAENMPRIAHREHRRGFIEGQAAPAGTPPPAPLPVPAR